MTELERIIATREILPDTKFHKAIESNPDDPLLNEIRKGYKLIPNLIEIIHLRVQYLRGRGEACC